LITEKVSVRNAAGEEVVGEEKEGEKNEREE
jgi:hypothetical protein